MQTASHVGEFKPAPLNHKLIRDAQVRVKQYVNEKKQNEAVIDVIPKGERTDERYVHRFPASSRVSKHLDVMTAKDLQDRLNGGTFFFIEDELVDFRDGLYPGHVHDDYMIDCLMELLGAQRVAALPLHRSSPRKRRETESKWMLRKVWNENEIIVPGYQAGGEFQSQLSFVWNPFVKVINSAFDLIRLICTNGMIGLTSFLNTKVPLVNRFEEHLDIAARQIQNKVNSTVKYRVDRMAHEGASVADCLLLQDHAFKRLHAKQSGEADLLDDVRERLLRLMNAVAPAMHLSEVYKADVFSNRNLAAQLPAHLSQFDVFNIATELRTHTMPTNDSSDNALDKFANGLMFDSDDSHHAAAARLTMKHAAPFSDPEQAFFGTVTVH